LGQAALSFTDDLGVKRAITISRGGDLDLTMIANQSFLAAAIAVIAAARI